MATETRVKDLQQQDALDRWEKYHRDGMRRSNRFIIGWAVTSAVLAAIIAFMVIK